MLLLKKKIIYLKLVSDPNFPFFLSFKTLYVVRIIRTKNNTNRIKSAKSSICRLKSFNSIKLRLMKVKKVKSPNNIQTKDVAITHFVFLMV